MRRLHLPEVRATFEVQQGDRERHERRSDGKGGDSDGHPSLRMSREAPARADKWQDAEEGGIDEHEGGEGQRGEWHVGRPARPSEQERSAPKWRATDKRLQGKVGGRRGDRRVRQLTMRAWDAASSTTAYGQPSNMAVRTNLPPKQAMVFAGEDSPPHTQLQPDGSAHSKPTEG
jgi:hypothetical protein